MLKIGLVIVLVTSISAVNSLATTSSTLSGVVTDSDNKPVVGATVIALQNGQVLSGTATDADGSFELKVTALITDSLLLRVSSVGYQSRSARILPPDTTGKMAIVLTDKLVQVGSIRVSPTRNRPDRQLTLKRRAIQAEAEASLVPTNPIAALKQPEVSRAGSSHSSQIRVHGTSPVYYLNGLPIGTDPAHYGLFAIIPSSVIDRISFHPMGTPARHRLASVVEFNTAQPFGRESRGELILSTIEATGSFAVGGDNFYVLGSLRKSVLDRLVQYFDISSDRATLPPTNFQDIFGSVGVKLSRSIRLMVDHYQVRDYLSYNTGAATNSGVGINTYQSSQENMLAVRMIGHSSRALIEATAALRTGNRHYRARPSDEQTESIKVDISERYTVGYTRLQSTVTLGASELTAGFEAEFDDPREQSLDQHNWNFLPPFSNTDNPFIYQQALNETYDTYQSELKTSSRAAYVSLATRAGRWQIESGLRYDQFRPLQNGRFVTMRASVMRHLNPDTRLRVVYGSFASTPLDNILEPYQILIRAHLDRLTPETTSLVSVDLTHRSLTLNLFHKRLNRLPILVPDFVSSPVTDDGRGNEFLSVRSEGAARFSGGSITWELIRLGDGPFSFFGSYAYTQAYQIDHALIMPHELDSPHRVRFRTDYKHSDRLTLGAEFTARSGYPYSPIHTPANSGDVNIYTDSYYASVKATENTLRFATNTSLNLRARYRIGQVDLMLSVANITNRANPIINTSSGQIYDAGIMPMLGLKYQF